ncbi:MAG TPA: bifunctional diaminohydroxyphosphoribosylaminopyrimidine deaminase/5-amino-6-(5-phosphoribosylamino)uracil reductase RibD [Tepidiformaceae bacterium]|nr:bifunctional diaminohydroxyphosphoribosylaminopyrimidine deaminase/5-amino-6-(5-phosphoribosylamino)uracil reductase RibD [Tepidiformaceae bacterium]
MSEPSPPMEAAIAAARAARGHTSPNPWVGAVIVRDGRIVSTGATSPYGGPHAEAAALANVDARGATLYTTLEPCVPFEGKRTPPCSDAIIAAGVARVVVGILDPHVGGPGVARLRAAGIAVEVGDGAVAITELLRPYLRFRSSGRPYVIAKFAVSLDGMVGAPEAGIRWLTGSRAIERAHEDRAWIDAILVGSGTVIADDPSLTARPGGTSAARQPIRVVLDGRGRSPVLAQVFGGDAPTIAATSAGAPREWKEALRGRGVTVLELENDESGVNLHQLLAALGQRNIVSLIAEGGPTVLAAFFADDLVDEVRAYVAPRLLGQGVPLLPRGLLPQPVELRDVVVEPLGADVLVRGYTGRWSP